MQEDRYKLAEDEFGKQHIRFWNRQAAQKVRMSCFRDAYRKRMTRVYQFVVPPQQSVLQVGSGNGDLLDALAPARGVGIDFAQQMVDAAKERHSDYDFVCSDVHQLDLGERFDTIIMSDIINELWDVQKALDACLCHAHSRTRLVINFYSHLWEIPLRLAARVGLGGARLRQNWLTCEDVLNLLNLAGFETIRVWQEVLLPVPLLGGFFNRFLVKLWPFKYLALQNFVLARPRTNPNPAEKPSVSVVIAARNEEGNIKAAFERTPEMGRSTEFVFVEGHSRDDTYAEIERQIVVHSERPSKVFRQAGEGKGDAIRKGFAEATGDILMILDADLTMPPEDLPRYYDALVSGKGEFINGVRLVYPMEGQAMRFLNLLGNKFFSLTFSWLLGQSIKDTLCGTKVLWRTDYEHIAANRAYFGDFDPFGDFDLIFGAAKLGLRIVDVPIRYRDRTYGAPNIQRWKHGLLLLRMVVFAARRIKFV